MEAKGSRENVSTRGETGKRASSPPVCARDPAQVSKRRKLKKGEKGSAANASGQEEASPPRGGGEASGDLPSGVASAAGAVGGTGTTRSDNGGEGGRSSSISSRDKSSETCEVQRSDVCCFLDTISRSVFLLCCFLSAFCVCTI